MAKTLRPFLGSLRLAIVLLIVLTVLLAVGMLIPQGLAPAAYLEKLGPFRGTAVLRLGLNRVFSSWWFAATMSLLAVNIFACSLGRLLRMVRQEIKPSFLAGPKEINGLKYRAVFVLKTVPEAAAAAISTKLRHRLFRVHVRTEPSGALQIHARRGLLKPLGSFVFHLGIILLLAGGLIGRLVGYSYLQQLGRGETAPVSGRDLLLRNDWFRLEHGAEGHIKDYKSKLTLLRPDSTPVIERVIEVNHPLRWNGLHFYQTSYRQTSDAVEDLRLTITGPGILPTGLDTLVPFRKPLMLGESTTITVSHYLADFTIDPKARRVGSRSSVPNNPAARVSITRGQDTLYRQWVFLRFPHRQQADSGYTVTFTGFTPEYTNGITIRYNPGRPLIRTGILLMTLSIFALLYVPRLTMWVLIDPDHATVSVGAISSEHPNAFSSTFHKQATMIRSVTTDNDDATRPATDKGQIIS